MNAASDKQLNDLNALLATVDAEIESAKKLDEKGTYIVHLKGIRRKSLVAHIKSLGGTAKDAEPAAKPANA